MFLTIDGGIHRECSIVYQMIVMNIHEQGFAGLTNLVLPYFSVTEKSLFKANIIKKNMIKYLKLKRYSISLYIPETLGGCNLSLGLQPCISKYSVYIDITNDTNWIGLLIWQHKYGFMCNFNESYKCIGCTESGTKREMSEGKKYSNTAWEDSMKNGMVEMNEAPGGRYKIHTTGGKQWLKNGILTNCISVIEDYSVDKKKLLSEETLFSMGFKYSLPNSCYS
jgi:hypothetical protein